MPTLPSHIGTASRDRSVRDYVDRHCALVVSIALLFVLGSCIGLVLMLGFYTSLGGDSNIVVALGLSVWLLFNGWAARRFMGALRIRATAEKERLRLRHFKPMQQTT